MTAPASKPQPQTDATESNARRYEWLRGQTAVSSDSYGTYVLWPSLHQKGQYWLQDKRGDLLDSTIDAAIAAERDSTAEAATKGKEQG